MAHIITCIIDPNNTLLTLKFDNNTEKTIPINDECEENLELIYKANIIYRSHQYEKRNLVEYSESVWGGCLPSVCLLIDKPSVNINTRYLINVFIEHMSLLFRNENNGKLFERDDQTISVPISVDDMNKFYDKMMEGLLNSNPSELDTINESNSNIQYLMKMILQFILTIKSEGEKSINNKNLKKLKRGSNMIGRVNYQDVFEQLNNNENNIIDKEEIAKNLKESTANIQKFIYENREEIKKLIFESGYIQNSALYQIVEILKSDHDTPLYIQYNVSFDKMFEATGQIMNAALYTLIPKTSFMLALQASFYNAAFLHQLGVLNKYSDDIFSPIVHRLTFSCFKSDVDDQMMHRIRDYMTSKYPDIVTQISKMSNDVGRNVDVITRISGKIDMRDEKCLDGLYWLLNDARGYTFEYYVILLAHIFLNTKRCKNLNRLNKKSMVTDFLIPLYNIMFLYMSYVTNECGLDVALSSKTLETFNRRYNDQIFETISQFSSYVLR